MADSTSPYLAERIIAKMTVEALDRLQKRLGKRAHLAEVDADMVRGLGAKANHVVKRRVIGRERRRLRMLGRFMAIRP